MNSSVSPEDVCRVLQLDLSIQEPDYYQFLGVERFESSNTRIQKAISSRYQLLNSIIAGPDVEVAQSLLNRLARIGLCFSDPDSKASYDQGLERKLFVESGVASDQSKSRESERAAIHSPNRTDALPMVVETKIKKLPPTARSSPGVERFRSAYPLVAGAVIIGIAGILTLYLFQKPNTDDRQEVGMKTGSIGNRQPLEVENPMDAALAIRPDSSSVLPTELENKVRFWIDGKQGSRKGGPEVLRQLVDRIEGTVAINSFGGKAGITGSLRGLNFHGKAVFKFPVTSEKMKLPMTIAFLARGEGILFSAGDPYLSPGQAISLFSRGHMRVRTGRNRFLATRRYSCQDFIPRIISIGPDKIELMENGDEVSVFQSSPDVENQTNFSIGGRSSSRSSRERSDRFQGVLAELLILDSALSKEESLMLIRYLTRKWIGRQRDSSSTGTQ